MQTEFQVRNLTFELKVNFNEFQIKIKFNEVWDELRL